MQRRTAKVEQALDQLGNPFDQMSLDQKKELALFMFYRRLKVNNYRSTNKYELCHSVSECFGIVRMCDVHLCTCVLGGR